MCSTRRLPPIPLPRNRHERRKLEAHKRAKKRRALRNTEAFVRAATELLNPNGERK